jgi:hypothetical protein
MQMPTGAHARQLVIVLRPPRSRTQPKVRRVVGEGWHIDFAIFVIRRISDFNRSKFFGLMGSDAFAPHRRSKAARAHPIIDLPISQGDVHARKIGYSDLSHFLSGWLRCSAGLVQQDEWPA